ncbi:HD domain-containing protein [Pseudomonas saponiphila]|uniref:HD domain-containing protein n=1 Tax=Pseudomonas saponiphila TaxID=556534 RepID=A0A1H4N1P4_9PSED|nr:HD domain-containing protein [Pseudomonas saponiphila]SEB89211.1 HD domain-containing protein [Pseudomonas saponiphila]
MLLTRLEPLDELLQRHRPALGKDFLGYRNHVYRVINFCNLLIDANAEQLEKLAIAGAFHDLGIWTARTFDYLPPSLQLAEAHLDEIARPEWKSEVLAMIELHHKVGAATAHPGSLVESFRRADWIDVSLGLISFGIPRDARRQIFSAFPDAGFHLRLVQLSAKQCLTRPWKPLPMLRW